MIYPTVVALADGFRYPSQPPDLHLVPSSPHHLSIQDRLLSSLILVLSHAFAHLYLQAHRVNSLYHIDTLGHAG